MFGISANLESSRWVAPVGRFFIAALLGGLSTACVGRSKVPPPEAALSEYVKAVEQADVSRLRDMMTSEARSEYSAKDIERLLERDSEEFLERAKELSRLTQPESGAATVYLSGGRAAALRLHEGRFWVMSAGLVPEMPRTPEEAAESLRDAVAARDYAKIERTLSEEARRDFVRAFDGLEKSLSQLDTAIVHVRQDEATIEFLDGRVISLKRQGTAWRVETFE